MSPKFLNFVCKLKTRRCDFGRRLDMFSQSKILVWYEIASQKVVLGEALTGSGEDHDIVSLWRHAPVDNNNSSYPGYRLSLYDDGGREIGHKSVSMGTADEILFGMNKARA